MRKGLEEESCARGFNYGHLCQNEWPKMIPRITCTHLRAATIWRHGCNTKRKSLSRHFPRNQRALPSTRFILVSQIWNNENILGTNNAIYTTSILYANKLSPKFRHLSIVPDPPAKMIQKSSSRIPRLMKGSENSFTFPPRGRGGKNQSSLIW